MLNRDRLHHITARGCLIAAILCCSAPNAQSISDAPSGQESAADVASQPQAEAESSSFDAIKSIIERIARALEAANTKDDSTEKKEHDASDLRAQNKMALWTFWMFVAAATQVLVSGVGLFFIWRTLEHSRDATKRELRAYVGVEKIFFELRSDPTKYIPTKAEQPGIIFQDFIAVKVKNFGETPAYKVSTWCGATGVNFLGALPEDFDFDGPIRNTIKTNIRTYALINRSQAEIIKSALLDVRPIWDGADRKMSIYVFGRIFYRDAYDRPWSTKFCYIWEPWHPGGERFVPYKKFNGEDQEVDPEP